MKKLEAFPGVLERETSGYKRYVLTDEQEKWLIRNYPLYENNRLIKASGMTHSTLHRFARQMNLMKSEKGMRGIKKRQAAQIKRTCERNGYYDSLRGHRPSEACLEGSRRMHREVREGKREHYFTKLKREHPRKYKRYCDQCRLQRLEIFRKEKLRMKYGLERLTRLHIPLNTYSISQKNHRHNALKRGYVIVDDLSDEGGERWNIYYDGETERSERFEKNLREDGFKVKEWKEM